MDQDKFQKSAVGAQAVIKKDGIVVEAVQIKNIWADLTLSSLALTKTPKGGEGFFKRMCSLHTQNPNFNNIKVVYFGHLLWRI